MMVKLDVCSPRNSTNISKALLNHPITRLFLDRCSENSLSIWPEALLQLTPKMLAKAGEFHWEKHSFPKNTKQLSNVLAII